MRNLFKTVMTGSMVAGAALLVAACGGSKDNTANNTQNIATDDLATGNDTMATDATGNASGANLGPAAGLGTSTNTTTTTRNTTTTGNTTTGAGTLNATGL